MIKFNTPLRVVYTLGVSLILSQAAYAQQDKTVLNFVKATVNERSNANFAVTNPTSSYADVQFTFYGLDGNPVSSGLVNPVRYRVAPKGQISMRASDAFVASKTDGWVQVTSPTPGLGGFYLLGDFTTTLEGSESAAALSTQVVPVIRDDQTNKTELVVLNPGSTNSTVTITLFNARGEQTGTVLSQIVVGHAALRLSPSALNAGAAGTLSARISASVPVSATAIIDRGDSLLFAPGQAVDQTATFRVAPHFMSGNGFDSVLVLTNPNASPVTVTLTLLNETGGSIIPAQDAPSSRSFTIAANGSLSADARTIAGRIFTPAVNGWLRIESPNVALDGLVILDEGQAVTSVPLQTASLDRMIYSQIPETQVMFTGLAFVNPSAVNAAIDVTLVRADGSTLAQKSITVSATSKYMKLLRDIIPEAAVQTGGYFFVRSSTPIYGIAMLGAANTYLASMPPSRVPDAFAPSALAATPAITHVDSAAAIQQGMTLRVSVANLVGDQAPTFLLGGQALNSRLGPGFASSYLVDIPATEPGFANLSVRTNGLESAPVPLRVLSPDSAPTQIISGKAFYQKMDVTDAGLDLSHPVMAPIRNARVEVFSQITQSIVAVSETDLRGRFNVPVPLDPNLTIRVISRLRSSDLRVADNTNLNQLYVITKDIDGRDPQPDLLLAETSRASGAFNILEMIQRGNDTIKMADPKITPPAVTVFWSTRNRKSSGNINIAQGLIGTTYFNISANQAYVLGDRNDDADEFDDAVIIHEYAHMLAAKFSRDDSPGGAHVMGDRLDPRVAWSEGWANFFSSAVRNDAIWRDSYGPNGTNVLRYDLEDNIPPGDNPGYWSEASVDTLLWDLYDDHVDADGTDNVQYPFSQIWAAFTDLRNDYFVYLPYFLDHFLARNPSATEAVRDMVRSRSIDFQPNVRPSVTNPFPKPMERNTVEGIVDSLSSRRTNLMASSHFHSFTSMGGAASIRMDIIGLGPGDDPNANDLDLFLMDANGHVLGRSDRGLNGQSELVSIRLPATTQAATYVVEIRSFYTKAETGGFVFNSGQYRLSVSVQ